MNHSPFRFDDVNQGLNTLQSIVIVPHSATGVRTSPNTWEITLVVLSSGITAIY